MILRWENLEQVQISNLTGHSILGGGPILSSIDTSSEWQPKDTTRQMSPGNLEEPISFLSLFIRPCSLWNLDKIWVASKGLSCDFLSFHSFITLNFFEGKWIWVSVRLCQSTESWKPCLERLVFSWSSRLSSVMSFEPSLKWIQNEIKKHVNYTSLWLELHINLAPKWTRPSLTGKGKFTHFNHVQLYCISSS